LVDTETLERKGSLPDTMLWMSTSQLWIPLQETFAYSSGRSVVFRATADAPVAEIRVARANLFIYPLSPGTTTVTVSAGDETEAVDSLEFILAVLDDCPTMIEWGVVNYFPLDIGTTATYEFEWETEAGYWVIDRGVSEWVVTDVVCTRGRAEYAIEESRTGTHKTPGGEWPLDQTIVRKATVTDSSFSLSAYTLESIPRFIDSAPDTLRIEQYPSAHVILDFVRHEGLVAYSYHSSTLFMGWESHGYLRRLGN
jgi:hypothetical protein